MWLADAIGDGRKRKKNVTNDNQRYSNDVERLSDEQSITDGFIWSSKGGPSASLPSPALPRPMTGSCSGYLPSRRNLHQSDCPERNVRAGASRPFRRDWFLYSGHRCSDVDLDRWLSCCYHVGLQRLGGCYGELSSGDHFDWQDLEESIWIKYDDVFVGDFSNIISIYNKLSLICKKLLIYFHAYLSSEWQSKSPSSNVVYI